MSSVYNIYHIYICLRREIIYQVWYAVNPQANGVSTSRTLLYSSVGDLRAQLCSGHLPTTHFSHSFRC